MEIPSTFKVGPYHPFLKKSGIVFTALFIFFQPIPHATALEEISFYLAAAMFIALIVVKKNDFSFSNPLILPISVLVVWAAVGIPFSISKINSLHDFYAHLIKYVFFYGMVVGLFDTKKLFETLILIIIVGSTIFSLGGMIYYYGIMANSFTTRFVDPGYVPYREFLYVFASLLSTHKLLNRNPPYGTALLVICFVVNTAATFLTQNRGAFLALLIAMTIILCCRKKLLIAFFAGVAFVLFLFPTYTLRLKALQNQTGIRVGTMLLYAEVIKAHPLLGIGFGMQTYTDPALRLEDYNNRVQEKYRHNPPVETPHNMLFDITVRLGVVGLTGFLWIVIRLVKIIRRLYKSRAVYFRKWGRGALAILVAFLVQAMFHDATYGTQALVQYLAFALITILWKLEKAEHVYGPT